MTYKEIFNEVVSIMKKDSSTCEDMGAGDYRKYEAMIRDDMSDEEFTYVVKKYLATFGMEGHLSFNDTSMGKLGFQVMRYENALYVTESASDSQLHFKDKIIEIDGKTIEQCAAENEEFLMGETNERQGCLWNQILLFAKTVTVVKDGKLSEVTLKRVEDYSVDNKYSYRDLGKGTLYIKLLDFTDEGAIRNLYNECNDLLNSCENLIVDVRDNGGGTDTAFFPLFEYCYPSDKKLDDYIPKQPPMAINYSLRNCDARLKLLDELFKGEIPEDIRPAVENMKNNLLKYRGQGMVVDESMDDETGIGDIVGRALPHKVWIITDQNCGSSGDAFVYDMSFSPKVTVVGRPTLGIIDYSNCSVETWEHFKMVYPTSRSGALDLGEGTGHKGVPVDHYIPWTPEHLERDVDLEYVLEQI